MPTDCISFRDTAYVSKLICDYVEKRPELQPLYHQFPSLENFKAQLEAKQSEFNSEKRSVLVTALTDQYKPFRPSELTVNAIQSLGDENTFTVTTGHQLNLLGGPLYFLYKIISTINLAKELTNKYPKNKFVPVFWMASEDHDFEEINHFNFQNKRFQWTQNTSGAVGAVSTSKLSEFVEVFSNVLGNSSHALELNDLVEKAYLGHSNLADATRYLVHALFGSEGLVIIDGNDVAFKRLFIPKIVSELTNQHAFTTVSKTNKELLKIDPAFKAQVNPREVNLFYLKENFRERIVKNEGVYSVLNSDITWNLVEIMDEVSLHPERFSPNVIMRPLYQETVLPNLCYIGGGGELAYWLQLKSFFDLEQIQFPILLHRNSVLLITPKQHDKLDKLKVSVSDLFQEKQVLIQSQIKKISKLPIDFSSQKKQLEQQFKDLHALANQTDKSFKGAVSAQEKKQIKGLEALEKRLLKAEKKAHKDYVDRLESLHLELFPNGGLQERITNFSEFYIEHGDGFIESLKSELIPLNQKFHILTL
ncbi:MAG: bacillithiol biosynthesis cysteine-adding enzyme BshC [Flavobacteriaceae bacterium]|jgi:bacillithiol synthase|nr:bacillithiol biosynthesis cysteine-adding enzyme BshC [Flavobacteriaceae bacterium]MDG2498273.1 bacillithiol biosynthesis cysteine-adding enzyme BshC [Flavobacteriaceae bacterium]